MAAEFVRTFGARVRYKIEEAGTILGQLRGADISGRAGLSVDGLVFALTGHIALKEGLPPRRVQEFLRILASHLHYRYDAHLVGRDVLWASLNAVSDLVGRHRRRGQIREIRDPIRHVLGTCVLELDAGDRILEDLCDVVIQEVAEARRFLRAKASHFRGAGAGRSGRALTSTPVCS